MGLIVSQIRVQYLRNLRIDLEYKLMLITQTKMTLSKSVSDLMQAGNDFDPDSPTTKLLQQRQAKLKILEQQLDAQMSQYNNRLNMVNTEYEAAVRMRDENIKRSFTYGSGG